PLYLYILLYLMFLASRDTFNLSLHDALPISRHRRSGHDTSAGGGRPGHVAPDRMPRGGNADSRPGGASHRAGERRIRHRRPHARDRKSTRLNSSHVKISYAVFCLKKKKEKLS